MKRNYSGVVFIVIVLLVPSLLTWLFWNSLPKFVVNPFFKDFFNQFTNDGSFSGKIFLTAAIFLFIFILLVILAGFIIIVAKKNKRVK